MTVNPKEAYGAIKPSMSAVPAEVLWELGAAMREGANKYGRHNFLAMEIAVSTYYDAAMRHLGAFWMGEDVDPDSGISHVTKAMACMAVLRASLIHGTIDDDRPPAAPDGFWDELKLAVAEIDRRTPPSAYPITEVQAMECGNKVTHVCCANEADDANFILVADVAEAAETRARLAKRFTNVAKAQASGNVLDELA